jgi:hypothetical protein
MRIEKKLKLILQVFLILILICSTSWSRELKAESEIPHSKGQTVYVPSYSHIFGGNRDRPIYLAVTLSIRNTDAKHTITVTGADYYGESGKVLQNYIKQPLRLEALASTQFFVPASHKTGGAGANFIVKWESDSQVNPPIIESIMIGTQNQQGISFTSLGQAIAE